MNQYVEFNDYFLGIKPICLKPMKLISNQTHVISIHFTIIYLNKNLFEN